MDYWEKRQLETYKAGEMKVNQCFTKVEKAFNQTRRELQKTVESFYFRYAEENGLSYAAAQVRLSKEELGELEDFITLAMDNIGKYNQTVNNMSIKARITRYQALEVQIDALLRELYAIDYQTSGEKAMQEVYADSYYRTWYNIDQHKGCHSAFAQVDPAAVEELLKYPFNGANFSARIWKQKEYLPPFHCFCRCTDFPYYDGTDTSDMTRVARDPRTGKYVDVPADMTYKEWKTRFAKEA